MKSLALILLALAIPALAADKPKKNKGEDKKAGSLPYKVGEFIEPDFPFFSSVLDCRDLGDGFPKDNLTPRGLILNLGHNLWACFDVDLLRIACIWESEPGKPPITLNALAPRSYKDPGQKTKDGQDDLPKPLGKVWLANGLYPGWQVGDKPTFTDPRPAGVDAKEIGRGPISQASGGFVSVERAAEGLRLTYSVGGAVIREIISGAGSGTDKSVLRQINCEGLSQPLVLCVGVSSDDSDKQRPNTYVVRSVNGGDRRSLSVGIGRMGGAHSVKTFSMDAKFIEHGFPIPEWKSKPQSPSFVTLAAPKDQAYVLDTIAPPTNNPWKRNVRLADIAFLDDQGHAAAVTMDGDVWMISGLKGDLDHVEWRRFTSGLHEPMSIVARPNLKSEISDLRSKELFVFDRNGIWKLLDTNNDGECDTHEMFCNLFTQTAETREFPSCMKLGPKGELYICKGGQQGTTLGKDNGTVLRIAPDGKSYETIGHGLRQPFIGVNEKTGIVTASDQQGNYVPSTPIHIIRDNQFYGHLASIQPREQYPETIADPLTWIPHPVNPSGMTQVWLNDAKMGPLNGELIHIAYSRPDIFRVMIDKRQKDKPQAAVVQIPLPIKFAPLNGHVNPADGCLYLVGYQIWGTTATEVSGLGRVRYTGAESTLPCEVSAMDKGILVRFDCPVDKTLAANPDNYSVERWNYKRTWDYGSAHYKLDGTTGQEMLTASSAYVSEDGRSVFVAVPGLQKCDQMHLGWSIKSASGKPMAHNAYFTPWNFATFDAAAEGFGELVPDMTPRVAKAVAAVKPSVEEGQRLYQFVGCMGCHSVDGGVAGRLGPSWKGLFGSKRLLSDDTTVVADEAYIRESILEPSKKKAKAYLKLETGMPIYAGVLSDSQIESIILYMKTLK